MTESFLERIYLKISVKYSGTQLSLSDIDWGKLDIYFSLISLMDILFSLLAMYGFVASARLRECFLFLFSQIYWDWFRLMCWGILEMSRPKNLLFLRIMIYSLENLLYKKNHSLNKKVRYKIQFFIIIYIRLVLIFLHNKNKNECIKIT